MPSIAPVYRTDTLVCTPNAGKLNQVRDLVETMRFVAECEARYQWTGFYCNLWSGFESMAKAGWSRPWTQSGVLNVSFSQMVMSQVAASLKGHMEIVKQTYTRLVASSKLDPHIRHQLHSINTRSLWFSEEKVLVHQEIPKPLSGTSSKEGCGKTGFSKIVYWGCQNPKGKTRAMPDKTQVDAKSEPVMAIHPKLATSPKLVDVEVSDEVKVWAKALIRKAMALHKQPHFQNFQPQIDQRACYVQQSHTAKHPDWLMLSMGKGKSWLPLPLQVHAAFEKRNEQAAFYQALSKDVGLSPSQENGAAFLVHLKAMESQSPVRNPLPPRYQVPNTVRLLLSEDGQSFRVGLLSDMGAAFEHQTTTYAPSSPDSVLCMDFGLSTLLATDCGELHGRNWMRKLDLLDRKISGIARHRQRLGLKVSDSPRYQEAVSKMRGWLKTEINRIINRLVERKKPARIVLELLDFQGSGLSRRVNRLLANFGKGILTQKMVELEARFGIVTEYRESAYTSQQCHQCGYVDKNNRKSQSDFNCQFCGLKQHADIQAARTLRDRRSVSASGASGSAGRRQLLVKISREFDQRYTRLRGKPADPRPSNPYYKNWKPNVRLPDSGSDALFEELVSSST